MLLRVEHVEAVRGSVRLAVDELTVDRGEVLAVLGPNGAGKSTLFRILACLDRPRSGRVLLDGRAVSTRDADARRRVAAAFQHAHLFAGTVSDNVAFGLRARGTSPAELRRRTSRWLDAFGIAALADADVRRISGGEAQRAALARAFATEPDLLLLDEPAAALDPLASRQLLVDLERVVHDERRGVLLVTHQPAEAFALAHRIAILEAGRLTQLGTPTDLITAPETAYAAAIAGAELLLDGRVVGLEGEFSRIDLEGGGAVLAPQPGAGRLEIGALVHLAYRPEDVVLAAAGGFADTSLANRFAVRVVSVRESAGGLVRVRLEGPPALAAVITRPSAERLGVAAGRTLHAALKATALRTLPAR